jgi:hypothetical protein
VKIPGVIIHRSDAILQTRHPAMLPPCTRVEDTVLDLIQIAPSFDDACAWICRAIGRRRTTADRIRRAMDARKKMRWRVSSRWHRHYGGALSLLEYRYVHRVNARTGFRRAAGEDTNTTGNRYLDNLYRRRCARKLTGRRRIPLTSSGVTSGATTPTW